MVPKTAHRTFPTTQGAEGLGRTGRVCACLDPWAPKAPHATERDRPVGLAWPCGTWGQDLLDAPCCPALSPPSLRPRAASSWGGSVPGAGSGLEPGTHVTNRSRWGSRGPGECPARRTAGSAPLTSPESCGQLRERGPRRVLSGAPGLGLSSEASAHNPGRRGDGEPARPPARCWRSPRRWPWGWAGSQGWNRPGTWCCPLPPTAAPWGGDAWRPLFLRLVLASRPQSASQPGAGARGQDGPRQPRPPRGQAVAEPPASEGEPPPGTGWGRGWAQTLPVWPRAAGWPSLSLGRPPCLSGRRCRLLASGAPPRAADTWGSQGLGLRHRSPRFTGSRLRPRCSEPWQ